MPEVLFLEACSSVDKMASKLFKTDSSLEFLKIEPHISHGLLGFGSMSNSPPPHTHTGVYIFTEHDAIQIYTHREVHT